MKLTYIYHSGFAIEIESLVMIIDYYMDIHGTGGILEKYLLDRKKRIYILSSHSHKDHFNPSVLLSGREDITYIFSDDIEPYAPKETNNVTFIKKGGVYQDENLKITAFGSTDIGVSFYVETLGKRIFHGGDLNNWHWNEEVSNAEAGRNEANYLRELEEIAQSVPELDLAMFPMDPRLGRDYMRGAEQFVSRIKTKSFAPMHFWNKYEKAAAFKGFAESKGCRFISWRKKGDEWEV